MGGDHRQNRHIRKRGRDGAFMLSVLERGGTFNRGVVLLCILDRGGTYNGGVVLLC